MTKVVKNVSPDKPVRLKSGTLLTDELLDELSREAEAGYAPDSLKPRTWPPAADGSSPGAAADVGDCA